MINLLVGIVVAYLLGSIPTGYLLIKIFKKLDIRKFGSGNIGATNVFRVGGPFLAVIVLVIDLLKGLIAVTLVCSFFYNKAAFLSLDLFKIILAIMVIAGHNWTIFLGFRGGKGVATSAGVFLGLIPKVLFLCALIWFIVFIITRYVSLASVISAVFFPLVALLFRYTPEFVGVSFIASLFIIYRHKSNIYRLLRKEESKISFKK